MTGEVKEGIRKRGHKKSKSMIGDFTVTPEPPMTEPRDVSLQKAASTKGKLAGKDRGRSWFKIKKAPSKVEEKAAAEKAEEKTAEEGEDESLPMSVERKVQGLYDEKRASPKILVTSANAARDAIREFSKEFLTQLKKNPEGCAAMEAQMRRHFALDAKFSQSDLKYLVQAYIAQRFFADFENASFGISNPGERPWEVQQHMLNCFEEFNKYLTKSQTVAMLLENNEMNDTFLSKFCLKKYKTLVSLDAGGTFLAGDEHPEGMHPDTPFYRSFLGAAVSVWLLQRLAFSFEQKFGTVYPTGGDAYERRFMEPVVPGIGDTEDENCDIDLEILFTVFPGFRVSGSIVQSSVYIVEKPKAAEAASPAVELGDESKESVADPESSSVEVEKKPSKQQVLLAKLRSFPKRSGSAAIKGSQKSSSLNDGSINREGDHHETFLQKVKSKLSRKKTKAGSEASSTVDAEEPTPALPSLEEVPPVLTSSLEAAPSSLEAAPSSSEAAPPSPDSKQDMNSTVSGEREASPLEPLNLELVNEPSDAPELSLDDERLLYTTHGEKNAHLQSPLRSPRLSSVD